MKKSVYLYVFDTMADWEVAYITAEINSGRFFKGSPELKLVTVANSKTGNHYGQGKIQTDIEIAEFKSRMPLF